MHICCPKGKWNAKTKRCRVGTRAQSIVMKAKRLGSGGETHADKAEHAFMDAGHHARLASRSAYEGRCKDAYRELLTAKGALEEGKAHAESGGGHLLKLNDASKTVERTETRVLNSCIAPSRTNK